MGLGPHVTNTVQTRLRNSSSNRLCKKHGHSFMDKKTRLARESCLFMEISYSIELSRSKLLSANLT